jgi:hypothetical protein
MQDVHVKSELGLARRDVQQVDSPHKQIGLKFKEGINEMLRSYVPKHGHL